MGLATPHYNVRYTIYLLKDFNILSRSTHNNGEAIYGLVSSVKQHVTSNEASLAMVNAFDKSGCNIIDTRSTDLANSKAANTARCKRKLYNNTGAKAVSTCTKPKADKTPTSKNNKDREATTSNVHKSDKATTSNNTEDNKAAASNDSKSAEALTSTGSNP